MSKNHDEFILILLQYVSIVTSGILGVLGLFFDFKDKKTEKLSKWGIIACIILVSSFALGVISKTIELKLQDQKEASDIERARIASERTLKIAINSERIANAISKVDINARFSIPLKSGIFKDFQSTIHQKIGISNNDRDFTIHQFYNLIPKNEKWKELSEELTNGDIVVMVYPKDSTIPDCIVEPMKSVFEDDLKEEGIRFDIPMQAKYVSYPQLDELFEVDIRDRSVEWKGPSILSLVDFAEATVIIYFEVPVMQAIASKIDQKPGINYRRTAAMQYEDASIDFYLNSGQQASVSHLTKKIDSCSKYPYFIGKVKLY